MGVRGGGGSPRPGAVESGGEGRLIVVAIVALALVVLAAIAAVFVAIPPIPAEVMTLIGMALDYFQQSIGFVLSFFQPGPVKAMVAVSIVLHLVYEGYKLVMWVATKVPMFGVSSD